MAATIETLKTEADAAYARYLETHAAFKALPRNASRPERDAAHAAFEAARTAKNAAEDAYVAAGGTIE